MKTVLKNLFFVLLVQVFLAGPVAAQHQPPGVTPMPHQNAYAQLQEQVKFLRSVAKDFPDPQLLGLLNQIDQHMAAAKQAAQAGKSRRATQELKIAQKLADQAMKLVVSGPVSRLQEQLDERIRQAEQALHARFQPEAQRLLQQAKQSRRRAGMAYKRHQAQKAVELYRMALYQVNKALQMVMGGGGPALVSALSEEKATYNDLRRRAQHMLAGARGPGLAGQLYQQALQQQRRAEEALSRGNLQQAVELYRWASRLLIRVMDMSSAGEASWKQRAAEEIEKTRELLRSVEQAFSDGAGAQARQLLQQAARIFLDARAAFARQQYPQAVKKAELSRRLLNRLGQLQQPAGAGFPAGLAQNRRTLRDLISQLKATGADKNPEAAELLNLAETYLMQSSAAEQMGNGALASARLFVAAKLANLARDILAGQPGRGQARVSAGQWVERFTRQLTDAEDRTRDSKNTTVRAWISLARDLSSKARSALRQGRTDLAARYSQMGMQLLRRVENRTKRN